MSRLISFEYLNRQLVWQELSEFLLFLLPLINVAKVRRFAMNLLPKLPVLSSSGANGSMPSSAAQHYPVADKPVKGSSSGTSSKDSSNSTVDLLQPVGPCPICGVQEILVPFVAHPCLHVFCYYCLRGHCAADETFQCPVDGTRVEAMQRYMRKLPV
eukprot:GHRR01019975.1.p2 GENE.GHRR01019975.1~~GHRR01019975.1.p2  ORF type:complete len:157 (+),score=48.81 GHRR01019975.1:720-1190(+)